MISRISILILMVFALQSFGEPIYKDGVLIGGQPETRSYEPVVVDSFPSHVVYYSMGLAFDGLYLWNNEGLSTRWFGRMDTLGNLINSFNPTSGNRDLTFDGQYLWATDWNDQQVCKYDTANCTIIASYSPPFGGRPNGMAWDGNYLWLGEEGGRIYQVDSTMTLIRSIPAPYTQSFNPRGLAFDGVDLWVGCQSIGTIFRIDTISGTILEQFNSPNGAFQQGLTWDGRYLWSTGGPQPVLIYKIDTQPVGIEEREAKIFTARTGIIIDCYPNPFKNALSIKIVSMQREKEVLLQVFDITGKLMRSFSSKVKGLHKLHWNGQDNSGKMVKPGIYLLRISTGKDQITKKVIHIE